MITIAIWNRIVTFSVIIPLLYGIINWKSLTAARPIIYILFVSFIFELAATISLRVYEYPLVNLGIIYQAIEILFFSLFISNHIGKRYKKTLYIFAFLLILSSILLYLFYDKPSNIVYGFSSLFEIIFCSIYILNNTKAIFSNWIFTIVFSFFQYNLLSIGIISISDYIVLHPQYLNLFYIIHSTTNLLLYLFFTIGLIQCKTQSSKVLY